jgi:hypothetical protein
MILNMSFTWDMVVSLVTLAPTISSIWAIPTVSKPNVKESRQRPEGDVKTTLGGFKGCMGFELRKAGHKLKYMHYGLRAWAETNNLARRLY